MHRSDVLLSSFPRSGNTWVRFFLANFLNDAGGKEVDFPRLDRAMPELGVSDLFADWSFRPFPRVVKTHLPFYWPLGRYRAVGLISDPRDAMVSYYRFLADRDSPVFEGGFSTFIRHPRFGLEAWGRHTSSWSDHWELTLRFEILRKDPVGEFGRLVSWLTGREVPKQQLVRAVERSSLPVISSHSAKRPPSRAAGDSRFEFVRHGGSGQWEDFFSDQDMDYLGAVKDRFPEAFSCGKTE